MRMERQAVSGTMNNMICDAEKEVYEFKPRKLSRTGTGLGRGPLEYPH